MSLSRCADAQCASCGHPWYGDGPLCPPCEEVFDDIRAELDACPACRRPSPDPGQLCPPCEEIRDEHAQEDWA